MKAKKSELMRYVTGLFCNCLLVKIFLLLGVLFVASTSSASTIHVSITGNDSTGTGAAASPYASIQKAVDVSQNGDTILVAPGTYSGEGNRAINLRGKQITVRSISGPVTTVLDLGRQQGILALSEETLATVVDGFTFQNGYLESGEDWRGDGIVSILGDSAITLRNCIFRNNETKATYVTTTTGIVVKRDRSSLEIARVENCLFYNNTIGGGGWTGVGGGQAVVVGVCGGEPAIKLIDVVNSTIANNTLYRSAEGDDGIRIPVSAGTVRNSIVWGNGDGFFPPTSSYPAPYQTGAQTQVFTQIDYSISEKGVVLSAGAVGNVMTSNPLFTDASNGDFTLATGSTAIDAGDPSWTDPDGSRSDIGFSLARAVASNRANLLVNGSFENSAYMPGNSNTLNPAVDGWSGSGNFQVITNGLNYTDAYQGEKALVFNAGETFPDGSIEQTVAVQSSETYFLLFWLRHDGSESDTRPGTVGIKAELLQNGTVIAESSIYLETAAGYNIGQWYPFSLQASSTAASMTVRLTDISTSGALRKDISIDSISLTPLDSDGDGVNDYREGEDGTDPNDPDSFNPLSKGLVAYYPFNGNANDESGLSNNLSLTDAELVADRSGGSSGALKLNTNSSYAESANLIGVSGDALRSVSFWVRTQEPLGVDADIISWGDRNPTVGGSQFLVALQAGNGGEIVVGGYYSDVSAANLGDPFLGRWNQVTYVYSGSITAAKIYLNGKSLPVGQNGGWVAATDIWNTVDTVLRLGSRGDGRDLALAGTIVDDVRVYNRALTETEVAQLYQSEAVNLDSDGDGLSDAWERGFGRYQVIQGSFTWEEAKADAEARGGHLATITLQEEQDFIVSLFEPELREGRSGTWIGAYQTSKADEPAGNWAWSNGEIWSFANWNVAPDNYQGDQDYGYIIGDFSGFSKWDDAPLAGGYTRYLLEFGYPTDPFNADSDGDGFNDSIETHYKTDPNNASVTPNNSRPTGVVSQWVAPEDAQSDVPSGLTDVVQVAAGGAGYALKANGTITAWGEIWSGSGSGNIPAYVPEGLSNVVQVDAGINYVLALKGDGTLVTWGHFWNGNGHQAAFVPEDLSCVVQISAGISHAAALKADGTVAVWGTNNWGQLDIPVGLSDVVQVEAGGYHTMALKSDGTVVVWGGIDSRVRNVPAGLTNVVKIAAGGHVCVALKSDGTVFAWGSDNLGGTDVPAGLTDVVAISASPHVATIAVKQDGTAVSWGDKSNLPRVTGPILAADAGWGRNIVLYTAPADSDNDGIPDNYETNTGTWVSATDTGTDPNNPDTDGDGLLDGVETNTGMYVSSDDTGTNPNLADTDGDGLSDGVETATWLYLDASDTGTDPNIADTDGDGLSDGVETNTGVFASASNTGSNPLEADTSGDGLHDGDLVAAGYNPNTNYTQLFNLVKMKGAPTQEAIGLFTESSIMDLNLGGVTLRRSGSSVNLRLQLQTKSSLSHQWTNHSVVPLILDMPGNHGFMRVRALGQQ